MDEDVIAKAPVTRLRRRLSVEQSEESKSPAPSTPTKKRGARTVKPHLELIEENGPEKTPNKRATRKSIVKDVVEEEKPLTPSRRSARIRSNTSIISDTPQNYDSPRAKRATRRNSQVGSDNETPAPATTPARTRRTRKDSVTIIDKPADTTLITDVISEEPEIVPSKLSKTPDNSNDKTISPNSLRKSTRLQSKQEKRLSENIDDKSPIKNSEIKTPQKEATEEPTEITKVTPSSMHKNQSMETIKATEKADLSLSSHNLIDESCKLPLKTSNAHNKSLSSLKEPEHNKRTRTKSWTTMAMSPTNDSYFLSDNESAKKKVKSKFNLNNKDGKSGSGDSILINSSHKETKDISSLNSSLKRNKNYDQTSDSIIELGCVEKTHNISKSEQEIKAKVEVNEVLKPSDTQKLFETSPETIIRSKVYIEDSDSNTIAVDRKQSTEDQCVPVLPHVFDNQSNSPTLNQINSTSISKHKSSTNNQSCEPMDIDETMPENVVLNDSDDKSINISLKLKDQKRNSLDVVDNGPNISKRKSSISNSISEDVKQTAENINLSTDGSKVSNSINSSKSKSSSAGINTTGNNTFNKTANETNNSKRNSMLSSLVTAASNNTADINLNKSKNKSIRKSSLSYSLEEDANKSANENKSTLVLSQLKENDSLIPTNSKKDISLNVTDIEKNHKVLQNVCSTSTPLQDKIASKVMKQRVPINVSDIITKQDKESDNGNVNKTQRSDEESSDSDSDNENKNSSKLIIDEADETSDNYESGDSQDEEERQYERENDIIDKGETLTSDDDASNDTDYEKDSFVVSSDEEDNELLDGSGDDLALSDNELTMTAKSKKKYNERKLKEQKQASREMFEARHNANNSKTNHSKTGQGLDSKLLDSDDDSMKSKPKKTNRLRLNSSQDTSMINSAYESIKAKKKKSKRLSESIVDSDADESLTLKKKRVKRLSESIHENFDEKEISVYDTEVTEKDPLEKVKEEPKTPHQSFICENIENVEVDEDVSIMKGNQSRDPLQSTIAQDEEEDDDDDSDISSNPEITSEYTNLLNNLNNISKKEKNKDISLNIDSKSKERKRDPIIDQLNLTLTKKIAQTNNKVLNDQEDSSDSIDMKLLFTEDSNDSEDQPKTNQNKPVRGEDFIPLKRTEAKTNIHEHGAESNLNKSANESLNKSLEKKKANELINQSLNISLKKNKEDVIEDEDKTNKSVVNVSANQSLNTSSKRKKKNSISAINEVNGFEIELESSLNESSNTSLNTSKKKQKNSISASDKQTAEESILIIHDTIGNRKQKKNSISQADNTELEVSLNTSVKKNKKNSVSEHLTKSANTSIKSQDKKEDDEDDDSDVPEEISYKSMKNKSIETKTSFQAAAALYDSDESPENRSQRQSEVLSANDKDTSENVNQNSGSEKKKRKRKKNTKNNSNKGQSVDDNQHNVDTRKRKLSAMSSVESTKGEVENLNVTNNSSVTHKKKKQKVVDNSDPVSTDAKIQSSSKENRKRKERDGDFEQKAPKVIKETGKQEVSRLPVDIINKLGDKPDKHNLEKKKAAVVSTSEFVVDTAKIRKNKPSHYLEESIYLNQDSPEKSKEMRKIKKPKVLPFVPTATTSGFGFTTNFKVSVIPTETKFEAKTAQSNFKNDYLQKKLKKFGTYELLKTQRKVKMSKF